jgi:hypothetical protein
LKDVPVGSHRLDILATAVGMIKGDWQISAPMNCERKGIWRGVKMNGTSLLGWKMYPLLQGEKQHIAANHAEVGWSEGAEGSPLSWYKTRFEIPAATLEKEADYRLDAFGLGKGMLFVNGFMIGRHWLIRSPGGDFSQRYYHVPASVLSTTNSLVVFEEQGASPDSMGMECRLTASIA